MAVVVSSPHRAQAFEAGRWLIDTLKHSVPIWKKEHYADGRMEWLPAEPVKSSGAVSHSETIDSEQPE